MAKLRLPKKSLNNSNFQRVFTIGAVVVVVFLIFLAALYALNKSTPLDVLAAQDWTHVAGATPSPEGIKITNVNRVINHVDTSDAQPNPPVNVRDAHLKVSGDFQIDAVINGAENEPSVQLYGQVPVVYDEWRQERESIRLELTSSQLKVRVWDGSSSSSIDERVFKQTFKSNTELTLKHVGGIIIIQTGNTVLGYIPDHNIFSKGTIWFGADAKKDSPGWTLQSLKARKLGKGQVEILAPPKLEESQNDPNALRNLAQKNPRHLPIGSAISINPLFSDAKYKNLAFGQFNMMTPENSMKPQFIHPQKDIYTYQDADSLVEAAHANNMIVHGHFLVSGKSNPEWMQKTPLKERNQVMVDHITHVVDHFKGKVAEWDVVNEPISEDDIDYTNGHLGLRQQMWSDAVGESYIDTSLRTAHAADPKAKLYLNDFGLEKDGKRWDAMIVLIKRLQARGAPINGVGFEAHVYHKQDIIDPAVLKQHIETLAGLGIVSRISELDVLGDNPKTQANQYSDLLKVCLSEPSCTSYAVWGVTDLYGSTTLSDRYPIKLGDSLLWGADYSTKLAFSALQNTLKQ